MYSALDLAKYVISQYNNEKVTITNLQLQKILFYIEKEFLQMFDKKAFPEYIEAWSLGPVVPKVHQEYSCWGSMPIITLTNVDILDKTDKMLIDYIISEKITLRPWELVEQALKKGGAWDKTYDHRRGNKKVIPLNYIRYEDI